MAFDFLNPLTMGLYGAPNANQGLAHTLMQMRAMNNMERGDPRMGRMPGQGGGSNPFMSQMAGLEGQPQYSQFTYDHDANAAATQALHPYGLAPLTPGQVNPNAMLPGTGFFGRHTRLAGALEGGLFGAASTQGSNTWGEGISNVARGLIEGPAARQAMWERQFARPFQSAQAMESLQDMQQKRELTEADIQWRRAEAQKDLRDPMPKYTGHVVAEDGSVTAFDQQGNPKQLMPPGSMASKHVPGPFGDSASGLIIAGELGPPPKDPSAPVTVGKGKNAYQSTAGQEYAKKGEAIQARIMGNQEADRASGEDAGHKNRDAGRLQERLNAHRDKWISDRVKDSNFLYGHGMDPNAKDTPKKVADYYDQNVAPYLKEGAGLDDPSSPMPQGNGNPYPLKPVR